MAQGVFDVLHPGHLFYLTESAKLGDELHVVIARDSRVRDEKRFLMNETARRKLVESLEFVDEAHLGTEGDIYDILDILDPDIITLGYDQPYDIDDIEREHEKRGVRRYRGRQNRQGRTEGRRDSLLQ